MKNADLQELIERCMKQNRPRRECWVTDVAFDKNRLHCDYRSHDGRCYNKASIKESRTKGYLIGQ